MHVFLIKKMFFNALQRVSSTEKHPMKSLVLHESKSEFPFDLIRICQQQKFRCQGKKSGHCWKRIHPEAGASRRENDGSGERKF